MADGRYHHVRLRISSDHTRGTRGRQMREFSLEELDQQEFDAFSAHHPQGNFQQTHRMGDVRQKEGTQVQYLGVREDGKLVAATSLEIHRSRLSSFAEIHDGPLCDFHDEELTRFLFKQLRKRASAGGAAQLSITPEAVYQVRDSFGAALPAAGEKWPVGVPKECPVEADVASFEAIRACGFVHDGFDQTYSAVPRWRYVKDLSGISNEKGLLATYAKNTKRKTTPSKEQIAAAERREAVRAFLMEQDEPVTRDIIAEALSISPGQAGAACKALGDAITKTEVKVDKARKVAYSIAK